MYVVQEPFAYGQRRYRLGDQVLSTEFEGEHFAKFIELGKIRDTDPPDPVVDPPAAA